ncbi:hypothetical protein ACHAWT_001608 [Skeletonema menzelii]
MPLLWIALLLFAPSAPVMKTRSQSNRGLSAEASPAKKQKKGDSASSKSTATMPLLDLGKLVRGTVIKRPSASIRSPYVADVSLFQKGKKASGSDNAYVLAHAPALDVGGMCVSGSEVYLSERPAGGKTSHAIELVRGAPLTNNSSDKGVLVGAHPRLGELIAQEVLKRGLLKDEIILKDGWEMGAVDDDKISMKQQVTIGDSRVDFQLTLSDKQASHKVIVEVKNVVCADYKAGTEPGIRNDNHCVVVAPTASVEEEYQRSALFPWGRLGQKYDGKPVVSERAIKHLLNLRDLQNEDEDVTTIVMFVVNRNDCESMRACGERCPVFHDVLKEVVQAGVKAVGVRVRWEDDGRCFFDGFLPVKV